MSRQEPQSTTDRSPPRRGPSSDVVTTAAPSGARDADRVGLTRAIIPLLRMTMRALQGHSRSVERHCRVNASQLWALWEIRRAGELRANDLARQLAVHASTVSNLLDRLEGAGYVERIRSRVDQRVVLIRATAAGSELLERSPGPPQGLLLAALETQSTEENYALHEALRRLIAHLPEDFGGVARVPFDGRLEPDGPADGGSDASVWPLAADGETAPRPRSGPQTSPRLVAEGGT